jgi:hypothetical protein
VRRFLRILFKTATALSLLLCLCFAALWVRSYFTPDALAYHYIEHGHLAIASIHSYDGHIGIEGQGHWLDPANPNSPQLGFSLRSGPSFWLPSGWDPRATIPHWHLLIYTGVLPLWWCIRRYISLPALQNRRRKRGLCPACGYDLRASRDLCPECGHCRQPSSTPAV